MNVLLSDYHLECIDFMNREQIPYFIDDTYLPSDFPHYDEPKRILQVQYPYPFNQVDEKLLNKLRKAYSSHRIASSPRGDSYIRFERMSPFDSEFWKIYRHRTIINHKGILINFKTNDSLTPHLPLKKEILLNLDRTTKQGRYHLQTIAALQLYNVEYLIVDHYPFHHGSDGEENDTNYMNLWLNTDLANAKLARKANKMTTGNAPGMKYFTGNSINFNQGRVYWRFFYKNLDFKTVYQRRCILNIYGNAVHFLHSDDL